MDKIFVDRALGLEEKDDFQLTGAASDMSEGKPIGKNEISKAIETLKKYKDAKSNLEKRIVGNEQWWKLRHWEEMKKSGDAGAESGRPEPASAWLFNSLVNKHADAMDNYPEPNVLPREQQDKADAESLSDIIPVILERNDFEMTYSNAWWYKLKHGTVPYGVFWNNSLEHGLGDVDIKQLDLLNLFWEPGITDIQQSRNLFITSLVDKDILEDQHPELKNKLGASVIDVKQYVYDDQVDVSEKSVVVDWYYKKALPKVNGIGGGFILHYCKFVGEHLLFSSENDPKSFPEGWYAHGEYPVAFDVLFPEAGTPYGFGYLDIMKDPQMYIDKLSQLILENAALRSKPRYWAKEDMGINEKEFLDMSKTIVHVQGSIEDEKLKPIEVPEVSAAAINILQMKIDELKETSSNRDVSQGGTGSGVTAAAAIAALQEAGNKTSRDMISASYRSYVKINYLVIELIRQFYNEARSFRITGKDGRESFVQYSNKNIQGMPMNPAFAGQQAQPGYQPQMRKPIFDIVIKPQKRSSYSRLAQNELAKELYNLGLFHPENAEPAMITLDMMDFDGDEEIKQKVEQGHTLLNMVKGLQQQMQRMNELIFALTGRDAMAMMNGQPQIGEAQQARPSVSTPNRTRDITGGQKQAEERTAMTNYGEELSRRATPQMGE